MLMSSNQNKNTPTFNFDLNLKEAHEIPSGYHTMKCEW